MIIVILMLECGKHLHSFKVSIANGENSGIAFNMLMITAFQYQYSLTFFQILSNINYHKN